MMNVPSNIFLEFIIFFSVNIMLQDIILAVVCWEMYVCIKNRNEKNQKHKRKQKKKNIFATSFFVWIIAMANVFLFIYIN